MGVAMALKLTVLKNNELLSVRRITFSDGLASFY
jgi:hypothetical protein